uniref:Protein with signal anchor n=1 Tax=Xenopsylla cheopis TaxID=163159 RepID=A0A6M2DJ16_XENCH
MGILATNNEYPKASNSVVIGGILTYVAGMFLLMAFASPYWIESYEETFSNFKRMGLWEYCFHEFRYPYYQFDQKFDGCHYIFREQFYVIREWLLPGWLMSVQAFVTLSFMLSFGCQILIALQLIRWPLDMVLRYEWIMSGLSFLGTAIASFMMFLAVAIFGGNCYRRDWLMYPSFNVLSWSYAFAVISFLIHALAALFFYVEAKKSYEMRREAKNLVMQMHEQKHDSRGYS